jgi:hypothetical protein
LRMSALHGTRGTHGSNRSSNNPDTPGGRRFIASANKNLTLLFWQHVERKKQRGHQEEEEETQEEDSPKNFSKLSLLSACVSASHEALCKLNSLCVSVCALGVVGARDMPM